MAIVTQLISSLGEDYKKSKNFSILRSEDQLENEAGVLGPIPQLY